MSSSDNDEAPGRVLAIGERVCLGSNDPYDDTVPNTFWVMDNSACNEVNIEFLPPFDVPGMVVDPNGSCQGGSIPGAAGADRLAVTTFRKKPYTRVRLSSLQTIFMLDSTIAGQMG